MAKRKYGDIATCKTCGQDIQWHGRGNGWRDRGGNRSCVTYLEKGEPVQPPKGAKHTPYIPGR